MSPLVKRSRPGGRPQFSTDQHWSMLLFESASAGVMAIFVGFVMLLAVVGVYVIIVWPLTFWDFANIALERYSSWINTALWSLFAGGSLAGYVCFSGLAFRAKPKGRVQPQPARRQR